MWGSPSLGVSVCLLAARERACYKIEGHGAPHTHRKRTRTRIRTGGEGRGMWAGGFSLCPGREAGQSLYPAVISVEG